MRDLLLRDHAQSGAFPAPADPSRISNIIREHETEHRSDINEMMRVLRGKRQVKEGLLEKHGFYYRLARGDAGKNAKYIQWRKDLKSASSAAQMGRALLDAARNVTDRDDAIVFLTLLPHSLVDMDGLSVGLEDVLDNWKYRGSIYEDLRLMLDHGLEPGTDLSVEYAKEDSGLALYMGISVFDEQGSPVRSWFYQDQWILVEYREGLWPKIVVRVSGK